MATLSLYGKIKVGCLYEVLLTEIDALDGCFLSSLSSSLRKRGVNASAKEILEALNTATSTDRIVLQFCIKNKKTDLFIRARHYPGFDHLAPCADKFCAECYPDVFRFE